jgi:hypothetical protein
LHSINSKQLFATAAFGFLPIAGKCSVYNYLR